MAQDQGFTADEIEAIPADKLGQIVRRNQQQVRELARQEAAARAVFTANPKPVVEPEPEDEFAYEEEVDGVKRKVTEKDIAPGIVNAVKKQAQRIKELERKLEQRLAGVEAREAETNTQLLDRVFAEREDVFGAGSINDIEKGSASHSRRMLIVEQVMKDTSHRSLEQKTKKAIDLVYGKSDTEVANPPPAKPAAPKPATKPKSDTKGRITEEEWNAASLKRPTHRNGAAEPPGRDKAISAVAKAMSESVPDENPNRSGETSLDDFPD